MAWVALAHLRWHGFIGLCWHDGVIIAVPPVPTPKMPHITFNVLNGLFLGSLPSVPTRGALFGGDAPGQVQGPLGIHFMGRTTDAGFITPHVSIPPNNAMLPLTILLGGSESMLGSSQVKIKCTNLLFGTDEQDMSACTIPYIPLSTNFGCNDPLFVPLDMVISPNTVMVGLTLADLFNMLLDLLIAAATEGLMWLGGKAIGKGVKKFKAKRAAKKMSKVSAAGDEAYQKALKEAELDEVLKQGLRKQRAKVTGTPVPPPKPKHLLEKRAKQAGDAAWHKAFNDEFGPKPPGKVRAYLEKLLEKRVSPRRLKRVSAAAQESYDNALKQAELDEALRDGLRKQRAKVTGSPAPPSKPRHLLEQRAKEAADETWNEAFKKEFGLPPSEELKRFLTAKRPETIGRLSAAVRTGVKSVAEEITGTSVDESLGNLAEGLGDPGPASEGEAVLSDAGETVNG